ncbi:hypothetical protein [Halorussus aquaticus]|uniref:Tat (Twin-arginine translocation) pathway signal sequence n=1 Tax=Halorussus aquaticus TaxID=2953748 RepID=A0ABD5PZD6_9EURY|nr:hypothetical protein [Halorussus aquaticus]
MTGGDGHRTRRGFLALAGAASLAGCNALGGNPLTDDATEIDGAALRDFPETEPPSVPETVPVEIRQSYLDSGVARARELLSSVPASLDAAEIPNGAIRSELTGKYEATEETISSVEGAASAFEAMETVDRARGEARTVAAGWKAIEDGLSPTDVRKSAKNVSDALDGFRYRWDYLGSDPIRALLVHATIERRVGNATTNVENAVRGDRRGRNDPIAVGELAGNLEVARASIDGAAHLYERLRATGDDLSDLESGLVAAGSTLGRVAGRRRDRLPDAESDDLSAFVDRDVEGTPVGAAIRELAEEVTRRTDPGVEDRTRRYANAVLSAHGTLVRLRALDSLRKRVAADEHVAVEAAEDLRTLRERAIGAIEDALAADEHRHLNRAELPGVASVVEYADEQIERYNTDRALPVDSMARDLGHYVRTAAMARAIPPTSAHVARVVRRSF